MKRIGIVTNFDRYNYGNRLQNYAVQTVLEKLGFACRTLVPAAQYTPPAAERLALAVKAAAYAVAPAWVAKTHPDIARRCNIDAFNRNIHFDAVKCEQNCLPTSLANDYDYFVTGSDQVWNPHFWKTALGSDEAGFNNDLLCFARPEQRACFAPSIGIDALPPEWNDRFRDLWNSYKCVGVREDAGARLIAELTGREDVQVMADPTLMLDASDWDKVAREQKAKPKKGYVLYMLLGKASAEIPDETRRYLFAMAKRKGWENVTLFARQRPQIFSSGAGEFLDLVRNAELVVTDSFHCSVFSFLYNRPFVVFKRRIEKYNIDMFSRIDTLLKLLALDEKRPENQLWDEEHLFACNYEQGRANLQKARESTLSFLKRSFDL